MLVLRQWPETLEKANPIALPFDLHYVLPVCGAVISKERSMKKIAVVASAVLMSMGLGMAGAQQTSSVKQNKKGVVMKGFVQDIRSEAKHEKDSGSCKCGIDVDGARNGRGSTNFVRQTKQKGSRYERFCARHRGSRY